MKKTILALLVLLIGRMSAEAKNANPYISISTNPPVVPIGSGGDPGGNSNLQIIVGNAGADNIAILSLEVTISVGFNAGILGLAGGSDPRWKVVPGSLVSGPNGTIKLKNTAGPAFTNSDLGIINLTIRSVAVGGPALISGNVSYIFGVNPNTVAQSSAQGNTSPADDNSVTTLSVVKTIVPSTSVVVPDLNIKAKECDAILNWKTLKQSNIDSFEIVYSTNGVEFTKLESIPVKHNETSSTYEYLKYQGVGKAYYRLKIFEKNGKFTYSKIVSIETKCIVKKGF